MPPVLRWCGGVVLVLLVPAVAAAWGFDAHRFIMDEAIEVLPREIRPYFREHRRLIVERTVDPDLWRALGSEEAPRHFLDLDAYGDFPFRALPRDYDDAVSRFGREKVHRYGLLPWRTEQVWSELRRAFESYARRRTPAALGEIAALASWLVHYISDAHVPFHAVLNYDGQLTGQRGIHSRFETELFRRYRQRLRLPPVEVEPVTQPRDAAFGALLDSFTLAAPVLEADRRARQGRETYDDEYFDRFYRSVGDTLSRRLAESIAAAAGVIAGAWEQGGRPTLPGGRSSPDAAAALDDRHHGRSADGG